MSVESLSDLSKKFESFFQREMNELYHEETKLHQAVLYSLKLQGKRVRPLLCLSFSRLLGLEDHFAFPLACSTEMIHTYSLIHDDLPAMDDDDLRRGKPSNHKVFGEGMAILAGDALLSDVPTYLIRKLLPVGASPDHVLQAIYALSSAIGGQGMVAGQAMDVEQEGQELNELKRMHSLKTGALLELATTLPLFLLGELPNGFKEEEETGKTQAITKIQHFAKTLGLYFQIRDDLLDKTKTTQDLGKTAGKDFEQGKLTFVTVLGQKKAHQEALELYHKMESDLQDLMKIMPQSSLQFNPLFEMIKLLKLDTQPSFLLDRESQCKS